MRLNKIRKNAVWVLVVIDYCSAVLSWLIFWFYRQRILHFWLPQLYEAERSFYFRDYLITFLLVPGFWLFLYYLSGTYFDLYKKSRLVELVRAFIISLIGCLTIGLIAFSNDTQNFGYFFQITGYYLMAHLGILWTSRMLWLYKIKRDLNTRRVRFNTLIVGNVTTAEKVFKEVEENPEIIGNYIKGLILTENPTEKTSIPHLPVLGQLKDIESIIEQYQIEEVILAMESRAHDVLENLLIQLSYWPVTIRVMPDLYDIISGSVRSSNVFGPVLISIHPELLPDWQRVCKRVIDVAVASIGLLLLSPLFIFSMIKVRLSSSGPIFYGQERIGLYGKPFKILKFRSMFVDAEKNGPALSSDDDPRITKWGRVMRKWRIDEIPQFINVLRGDMSLVGPRPERKYFIDKIVKVKPAYKYLHRVKPGITSWGMVQFGYAENIEQMIERMRYDLLYIQNCSLALDLKIIIYTFKVLFQGRGK